MAAVGVLPAPAVPVAAPEPAVPCSTGNAWGAQRAALAGVGLLPGLFWKRIPGAVGGLSTISVTQIIPGHGAVGAQRVLSKQHHGIKT